LGGLRPTSPRGPVFHSRQSSAWRVALDPRSPTRRVKSCRRPSKLPASSSSTKTGAAPGSVSADAKGLDRLAAGTARLRRPPGPRHHAVEGGRHEGDDRVLDPGLHRRDRPPSIAFVPGPVEVLGARPSWTMKLPDRSFGPTSPRFSCRRRISAFSSCPIMIRASEPPMKLRLDSESSVLLLWKFINVPPARADASRYVAPTMSTRAVLVLYPNYTFGATPKVQGR
jgi:hypothetical protein